MVTRMSDRFIPLGDPRRNKRGNRTVRISLATWTALQGKRCWPSANEKLRDICRVSHLHLPDEHHMRWTGPRGCPATSEVIASLIHGSHWLSTPMLQRKKYAGAIRALITLQRDAHERRHSFLMPGQSGSRIP